jgi:protein involved in polysaccharide export with SLBB domain
VPLTAVVGSDYLIGPQDRIRIRVQKHTEYDTETTVLANGKIVYQIPAGELTVEGKTRAEVQALVREALKFDLKDPQVTVEVVQPRPRPVYITGHVGAAQTLEWVPGLRIREALVKTGGPTVKPELADVTLRRRGGEQVRVDLKAVWVNHDERADLALEPGDQLDVQLAPVRKIYLMGEVRGQGPLEIQEGWGITQAIAQAGLTEKAALAKVMVLRGADQTIPIDLRPLMTQGHVPAPDFKLMDGDVIVVPARTAKYAVFGNVANQGYREYPENEPITATRAIGEAGGPAPKSKLGQVYILRGSGGTGQAEKIPVDYAAVMGKGQLDKDVVLQPNDVVFVPKSGKMQALDSLWIMQGVDWVLRFFSFGL